MLVKKPEAMPPYNRAVQPEIAARAVALCEGCPMAKLCATKAAGECPPPAVQQQLCESIDDGGGGIDAAPVSYRKLLLDDTVRSVMATPTPKPIAKRPKQKLAPTSPPNTKVSPRPAAAPKRLERKPSRPVRSRAELSGIGQAVADITHLIFGCPGPSAHHVKK